MISEMLDNLTLQTKIKLGLILLLLIGVFSLILSRNATPESQLLFGLKRYQENIFMSFKNTPKAQVEYRLKLLDDRLYELKEVAENKDYTYILKASLRYSTTAGNITEEIKQNNLTELASKAKQKFQEHRAIIQTIYDNYPKDVNVEYKFIMDDINYLDIYLSRL